MRLQVELVVAPATEATLAALQKTSTIPVVMSNVADPIGSGIVTNLAHPGGNVTGTSYFYPPAVVKSVELLKQLVPSLARLVVLSDATNPGVATSVAAAHQTAQRLGMQLLDVDVRGTGDLESAFTRARGWSADGVLALTQPSFGDGFTTRLAELVVRSRLPGVYTARGFAEAGGLMAFSPGLIAIYRRTATYVDKILRGGAPGDLPVEQPRQFDFYMSAKVLVVRDDDPLLSRCALQDRLVRGAAHILGSREHIVAHLAQCANYRGTRGLVNQEPQTGTPLRRGIQGIHVLVGKHVGRVGQSSTNILDSQIGILAQNLWLGDALAQHPHDQLDRHACARDDRLSRHYARVGANAPARLLVHRESVVQTAKSVKQEWAR